MTRRKEYDRQDVLEKAALAFWEKGYKGTSVADLVQATGLNTASMYKEFGDKDGLFEQALDYYREHVMCQLYEILIEEPNFKGVEAFLQAVCIGATAQNNNGCLIMNHIAQKNSISATAVAKINDYCTWVEGLLTSALHNAQANGDFAKGKDPAKFASFIMCSVHGSVLYSRHDNNDDNVRGAYDIIVGVLNA